MHQQFSIHCSKTRNAFTTNIEGNLCLWNFAISSNYKFAKVRILLPKRRSLECIVAQHCGRTSSFWHFTLEIFQTEQNGLDFSIFFSSKINNWKVYNKSFNIIVDHIGSSINGFTVWGGNGSNIFWQ